MAEVGERETLVHMSDVVVREAPTELEAEAVAAYLRAEGCPVTIRKRTLVAFPGIAEPPGTVAEVRVEEADVARARALLDAYDGASLDADDLESQALAARPPRDAPSETGSVTALAVRLGMAVSLLGNAYAVFVLAIEPRLGGVIMDYDSEGNVIVAARFERGDERPREVDTIDVMGRTLTTAVDANQDGYFERSTSFVFAGPRGVQRVVSLDENADGNPERGLSYRGDEVVVTTVDEDEDGLTETWTLERVSARLSDEDEDGFPDLYFCPETATVRKIDLRTCLPPE
jgi:hypothetical protein